MTDIPSGLYLSFDYGEKYIGVACGNTISRTCNPLAVVSNNSGSPDWQELDALFEEWQPVALVVGIPVHMDGSEQSLTPHARGFLKRLKKRYNLPAFDMDERLTTQNAASIVRENRSRGGRKKGKKADLDKIAAALILENWFGKTL